LISRAQQAQRASSKGCSGCSASVVPDGCATGRRRGPVWFLLA
jgi:hypothetical protein